ncbi:flagellar FliJ protein [Proteiniborus sp. DW1]|uniref:flagellar export protein FliJ n=1 Tax=Proteiniborus sp. DW1 TaxID=1889883 RepID=UPI00092DEBC3|nr:flagellar export protein FliJ [Proteiniborus sp. DW1]SCG83451.1 flagellar FliJ protein [Proteiniborus sp. DW1]
MEKFNFRLEKVLEYREKVEDINKVEYGKAKKKLDDEVIIFEEILSHKDKVVSKRDNILSNATINDLKNYNLYLINLKEKLANQKEVVEKAQIKVEKARNTLINSSIEKKTLENLKNRDFSNYLYQMRKEDDKIIDQIVSYQSSIK